MVKALGPCPSYSDVQIILPLPIFNMKGIIMGLRKIAEPIIPCTSPEHNPPMHRYYEPGTYEYTCPVCGKKIVFTVPLITC